MSARTRTPEERLQEARRLALENGMLVIQKGAAFLLYRRQIPRNTYIGTRSTPEALRALVRRAASHH